VLDATTDEDLHGICLGGCRVEEEILWVGSAGLARFLPFGWGCQLCPEVQVTPSRGLPTLLINGSLHPTNARQLQTLAEQWRHFSLVLEDDDAPSHPETLNKVEKAMEALKAGQDVTLTLRLHQSIQSLSQLEHLQAALQWCASQIIRQKLTGGLILVGGETATKIYREIGAQGIRVTGEVQTGIPHGVWEGGVLGGQPVITKAGGFGHDDTLLKAMQILSRDGEGHE
jgi:uncharacterized protein YgbK (DUF1537 family)